LSNLVTNVGQPSPNITMRQRVPAIVAATVLAALAAFALRDIFGSGAQRFPGADTGNLYAWEVFTRSVLASWQLPFWNPYSFLGTPHLADTQTTVLYPPALLLRLLLEPAPYFTWMIAFHVCLGGIGGLFLGRVVGLRWETAAAVGIATMFGGSVAGWIHNGHLLLLSCAAWTPWVFAFAILAARRQALWPPVGLVATLVLQFLAGYIQGSIYVVAAVAACFFYEAFLSRSRASRYRLLLQLLVLGVVTAGIAAFQLLPMARLAAEAGRTTGIPYSTAVAAAWTWSDFSSFFFPNPLASDRSAYVGWLLVCCAPFALLDRARRHVAGFLALLITIAVVLTLGDRLLLYRLHYALFPGFRIPGRVLIVATPALALSGAIGVEWLLSWFARQSRGLVLSRLVSMAGVAVTLVVAADLTNHMSGVIAFSDEPSPEGLRARFGPADGGRILSACDNRVNGADFVMAGFPTVSGMGGVYLRGFSSYNERMTADGTFPSRRDLWDAANVTRIASCEPLAAADVTLVSETLPFKIYRNDTAWPRAVWTCGLEQLTEWEVGERLREGRYENQRLTREDRVNIRWTSGLSDGDRQEREARYHLEEGERRDGTTWRYRLRDTSRSNLRTILKDAAVEDTHGIDRERALVTAPSDGDSTNRNQMLFGTSSCAGHGEVVVEVADQPNGEVRAKVRGSAAGYAVFADAYYPERRAFVDGREVPLWRTNLAFLSVPVPAGEHDVEIRFIPTTFYAGLAISVLTLVCWARVGIAS
jgi:hypothetical protein